MTGAADRFVCAINRDRDFYQVPLALAEAGLLELLVTDYYAPDRQPGWLPARLSRRRSAGIERHRVAAVPATFALQSGLELLGAPMHYVYPFTDGFIARKAGRVAQARGANLYCYSPYMPPARLIPPAARTLMFEYHPLPELLWDVLEADRARYPMLDRSHRDEQDAYQHREHYNSWRRADRVVCASSVTRRSLEVAGCDPAAITVIPYGFEAAPRPLAPRVPSDTCEFLFVGQGVQRKGPHHLIEAWQRADLKHSRLTMVCYRIDPGIADMIRSPTIRLLGRQDRPALDALYAAADVFAMPSLIEGFGLVYLEALSAGCYVIGSSNSGLPDLGLPAGVAAIISPGDIDLLASSMVKAEQRKLEGQIDRIAVQEAATCWGWRDFRHAVAAHAQFALQQ